MIFLMRSVCVLFVAVVLAGCRVSEDESGPTAGASVGSGGGMQQIINVSSYDPKEQQRGGRSYSQHDVSALRSNGAKGLIARAGKGGELDRKCVDFVGSADRAGMLPGLYYRVQKHVSISTQADQFSNRALELARGRSWNAPSLLLVGDYDGDLPLSSIVKFMDRVQARTGVIPVTYLENSPQLKQQTSSADPKTRAALLRAPYWLALYSHETGAETPEVLVGQYGLWPNWTMWQYGGVEWKNGRSHPKVYSNGSYRNSLYFGDMDRPLERNVFRGSEEDLLAFWHRHGVSLQAPQSANLAMVD